MVSSTTRKTVTKKQAPRAWQRMLSGRRLDLIDPSPLDVEIEDIAHGLARVARWNGQTVGSHAFSVAQHSVIVEEICAICSPKLTATERLTALLHDAPEYVIGDMISPFKVLLGGSYKGVEERLEHAVHLRFGLPAITPAKLKKQIKRADLICAWFEAVQLAGFSETEANQLFGKPPIEINLELVPEPVSVAQTAFLDRHKALLVDMILESKP